MSMIDNIIPVSIALPQIIISPAYYIWYICFILAQIHHPLDSFHISICVMSIHLKMVKIKYV